jgi:hypothetical protein
MKRKEILEKYSAEDNKSVVLADIVKKDAKFIKRRIQELENQLDDAKEALEARLQQEAPIDDSVVVSLFGSIVICEEKVALYKQFREACL